jgi:esterase/lipase
MNGFYDFKDIRSRLPAIQRVAKTALKDVRSLGSPLLVIHSRGARTSSSDHARRAFERARASEKRSVELTESGHIISDDVERTIV